MSAPDWSEGYTTAIDYTYGYYPELNPNRVAFALLMEGYAPPPPGPCCELGFGQGVSLAMNVAAHPDRLWYGTDFNPAQAHTARALAASSGNAAHVEEQSFAEFCGRTDLPQFAFISLHGIWSWISSENRALIVDFLRRKLMTGGVVYMSYNTMPGWASAAVMRHLMVEHARWQSAAGHAPATQMKAALDFTSKVFELEPNIMRANPSLKSRLADLGTKAPEYLAHEYLTHDWLPMYFSEMADAMQSAKLSYACSAMLQDRVTDFQLSPQQATLVNGIEHAGFRESVRDIMTNQQFRRDLWIRGTEKLARHQHLRAIQDARVALCIARSDIPETMEGPRGKFNLNKERLDPMIDALTAAGNVMRLGDLLDTLQKRNIGLDATLSMLAMLVGSGVVQPALPAEQVAQAKAGTDRLNAHILQRTVDGKAPITYLASPVIGGAIHVPALFQGYLYAHQRGEVDAAAWSRATFAHLRSIGRTVQHEGKPVSDPDTAHQVLMSHAKRLTDTVLPMLRSLQVVR